MGALSPRARSYTGLSAAARQDLVAGVTALAHAAGSDFSLLRVARPWSVQRYAMGVQAAMDICHGARDALGAYLRRQEETLRRREAHTPEIYLAVSLPSGPRRLLALADRGTISTRGLHALALEEAELFARLRSCLDCRRVAPEDLQWLIRRSFCRSLGDPVVDEQFRPQALVGDAHFEPLGADVLRLFDSPINVEPRSLRIESELGESHQTFLCAAPARGRLEPLFAPLEAVEFGIDAVLSARVVSDSALRAGISLCVSAPTREELEARVERVRSEHGWVELHRPGGDQLRLFIGHLPAQRSQVPDYEDQLTPERLGELAPIATHAVGADVGPYIGHTLNGTRRPVLFDPAEGVRADGASAILVAGAPCASKTRCMELIMYQAFLAGSRIYDIDPRGDHDLERLPGVAEHAEIVELSSRGRYRGMLDPLRVGTEDTRAELACRFLSSLLPDSVPPAWEREIRRAVQSVAGRATACCGEVAAELARGDEDAREAGLELAARAAVGLAGLCFGAADRPAPHAGSAAVTVLRIPSSAWLRQVPRPPPRSAWAWRCCGCSRSTCRGWPAPTRIATRCSASRRLRLCCPTSHASGDRKTSPRCCQRRSSASRRTRSERRSAFASTTTATLAPRCVCFGSTRTTSSCKTCWSGSSRAAV